MLRTDHTATTTEIIFPMWVLIMKDWTWLLIAGVIGAGIWVYRMVMPVDEDNGSNGDTKTLTDVNGGTKDGTAETAVGQLVDRVQDTIPGDTLVGSAIDLFQAAYQGITD